MPEEVDIDHLGPREPTPGSEAKDAITVSSPSSMDCLPEDGLIKSVSPIPPKDSQDVAGQPLVNGHNSEDERPNGMVSGHDKEQVKIQEYLNRNDTAVIYPQPVDADKDRKGKELKQALTRALHRACQELWKQCQEIATVTSHGKLSDEDRDVLEIDHKPKVAETLGNLLKCPHCDLVLAGHEVLAEHVNTSHKNIEEQTHRCSKCNTTFSQKEHLEKHELIHSTNVQSCKVCNKSFANVYRLQRHMISHDESTVLRKFKCPECGKAFKFKHHLKEHIRIHSGEKPFACPNCGKRFSHSGSYSSHMTSKKCLVMNLKMKKLDPKSARSRPVHSNNSFRPIIPKYEGGGGSAPPSATYLSTSENFQGYDYQVQSQPSVVQQFLPSGYYQQLTSSPYSTSSYVRMHSESRETSASPGSDGRNVDVNQDLKAVKKILEIVGATVSKQKQLTTNGILPELLSEQIQVKKEPSETEDEDKCKYCEEYFENRIDLRYHERCLCKANSENDGVNDPSDGAKLTDETAHEESRVEEESNKEVEEDDHNRRINLDTILSEETLQILKDQYDANPWRRGYEITRLAQQLGYSPELIELWFKNMRASDKLLNSHIERNELLNVPQYKPHTPLRTSPYTPVVPHYNGAIPLQWYPSAGTGHHRNPADAITVQCLTQFRGYGDPYPADDNEQPLDLSMKSHRDFQVLNLSQKSKDSSDWETSSLHEPASPRNAETSTLYKYMQRGAVFLANARHRSLSPKSQDEDQPSVIQQTSFALSPYGGDGGRHSSSSDTGSTGETMMEDTDGDTGSPKLKRIRKKTWKQMEAEESHSPVEDSAEGEEENGAKRRKSWKQHRLESEEGMYACDQCDKMFSKQSSLARHKYEHSGQRPHKCDVCNKAFKHKHHLTEHKRLHSGEKPFQCKKCLKRFSHSGSYSQHMNHRYSYCKPYRQ